MVQPEHSGQVRVLTVGRPGGERHGVVAQLRRRETVAVEAVDSVEAGLAELQRERYDCVVADSGGRSGCCRRLRLELADREYDLPLVPVRPPDHAAESADTFADGRSSVVEHVENVATRYRRSRSDPDREFKSFLWQLAGDVVDAPTRQAVEEEVCDGLVTRPQFDAVWTEAQPPDGTPQTAAGYETTRLERVAEWFAGGDRQPPWRLAAADRESVVRSAAEIDPPVAALVSVPLVHRGINYGVLNVVSEDLGRDRLEPLAEVLDDFGQAVGVALATVEMQKQSELFRQAIEQADPAISILDANGDIEYVNKAFESVFGYAKWDAIGTTFDFGVDEATAAFLDGIDIDRPWSGEIVRHRKDGRKLHISLSVAVVPVDGGQTRKYVVVASDITSLKEHKQRLQVLNRVLRHNLRNDLNVVHGRVAHVLEQVSDDQLTASLETARDTVESLLEMSEKARYVEENMGHSDPETIGTIDVVSAVERLVSRLRDRYPRADIDLDAPAGCRVRGNNIESALEELLINAIEHNDAAEPRVRITVADDEGPDGFVEVTIADNGPGIPQNDREAMQTGTESDLSHGSSLGLWLVKWILTYAAGRLHIEDSEMGGTVVKLHLRADEDEPAPGE